MAGAPRGALLALAFLTSLMLAAPAEAAVRFEKVSLATATAKPFTSLAVGPDGKLYAGTLTGDIVRFPLNPDGTTGTAEVITSVRAANGGSQRMLIGLAFDPAATAGDPVLWVTHSAYAFSGGPDWTGKVTRLSGPDLDTVQDYVVGLPRSARDHLTNSLAFGPDDALYVIQGGNSAMGGADAAWENRPERALSAAVLRIDPEAIAAPPLDVKTEEGGTYDPFAPLAPVKIHASGVRNAYDLVWHTNGRLYVPTNGSAPGGSTPASPASLPAACLTRIDSGMNGPYTGPQVPGLSNVAEVQNDFLFRVVQNGYYGHPNPQRCEWVMNGGNPTAGTDPAQVTAYPVGTQPDRNWRGAAFDFGRHRSPDGVIEYRQDTFGGALQGKLLVVRYSQGDDIIALTPGGPDMDIVDSQTGIEGFTGFADPLDLVENLATGALYVSEYGAQKITLLRPIESYVRPAAASPVVVPLVPAFTQCGSPNRVHGPPLEHPSCAPPAQSSTQLTIGSPDANGKAAKSLGFVKLKVIGESPIDSGNGDQADVLITTHMTDVRNGSDLSDYAGELEGVLTLRVTDRLNGTSENQPGTVTDLPFPFPVACSPTPGDQTTGSSCSASTSADALAPGSVREGKRAVWGLGRVDVLDGTEDNALFAVQGVYVP